MRGAASLVHRPLGYAWRVQSDASGQGFDWSDVRGVIQKVREELHEVEAALDAGDPLQAAQEVGDLLFSIVNLARFVGADPGEELDRASQRFEIRFSHVCDEAARGGRRLLDCTMEELDEIWERAKSKARSATRG